MMVKLNIKIITSSKSVIIGVVVCHLDVNIPFCDICVCVCNVNNNIIEPHIIIINKFTRTNNIINMANERKNYRFFVIIIVAWQILRKNFTWRRYCYWLWKSQNLSLYIITRTTTMWLWYWIKINQPQYDNNGLFRMEQHLSTIEKLNLCWCIRWAIMMTMMMTTKMISLVLLWINMKKSVE